MSVAKVDVGVSNSGARGVVRLAVAVAVVATVTVALGVAVPANPAIAEDPPLVGTVTRFATGSGAPFGVAAGPDGNMWVAFADDQIGRFAPDGSITYFPVPDGVGPFMITAGPDGNLWFTTHFNGSIGRITTSGVVTMFPAVEPLQYPAGGNVLWGIVAGPDGALWFTSPGHHLIGRMATDGSVQTFPNPGLHNVMGITAGPDGYLWFSGEGEGTAEDPPFVGKISVEGTFASPPQAPLLDAGLFLGHDITLGPEGNLWVADYAGIIRITPEGVPTRFPVTGVQMTWRITTGPDGNLWFTIRNSNQVGRMTPAGVMTWFPSAPDGSPANDFVNGIAPGPGGTVWFTNWDDQGGDRTGVVSRVDSGSLPSCAAGPFVDVPVNHAFCGQIAWMVDEGITTGYPDDTFRPAAVVSRQAAAAFLYRLAGSPDGPDPVCLSAPFTDVPVTQPFCGEIAWASAEGITNGYSDGSFRPAASVSRQSTAAFLYRFEDEPNGEHPTCATAPFADVAITHAFCGEIDWMTRAGITNGYPDGTFGPADAVTRQAMSAFLYRLDQLPA